MKIKNKLLNRIVAVGLLAVVLFVQIPFSYASVDSETFNNWFSSGRYHERGKLGEDWHGYDVEFTCEGSDPIYLTEYKNGDNATTAFHFFSKSNFSVKYTFYDGDKEVNTLTSNVYSNKCSMFGVVYSCSFPASYIPTSFHRTVVNVAQYEKWRDSGAVEYCHSEDPMLHIEAMTVYGGLSKVGEDSDWISLDGDNLPGSQDSPINDSSIGNLILTTQKGQTVLPDNRDTDASKQYQVFKWKSKTDTGFSLTKNKYAQTYVEAVVESRCVIYKHMNTYYIKNNFTQKKIEENNEIKAKFDNFGERGTISKSIRADSLEYVLSFDKIKDLLPKTAKEWHNDIFVGHNYRVYFRVLCTDSLTVIPDSSDGSWRSGGWSYVDFSSDGVVSGNGNGHFDENGEWTTDDKKDDIINGGNDTYIDEDSAKDDRNNSSDWGRKDNDDSGSGLDTGSIKSFLNQVGNVPKAIAKLFSFLPEWVTAFISFGFIVLVALMIIKAIRG